MYILSQHIESVLNAVLKKNYVILWNCQCVLPVVIFAFALTLQMIIKNLVSIFAPGQNMVKNIVIFDFIAQFDIV